MEATKHQVVALLNRGLHDSAQILGCFLVSSPAANVTTRAKAENLVLFADALFGGKQYDRALFMYRNALGVCRSSHPSISSPTSTGPSSSSSINGLSVDESIIVKCKIALCNIVLGNTEAVLSEINGIPNEGRSLLMKLIIGNLNQRLDFSDAAIACYNDYLRHCPYTLEAIPVLAALGIPANDILSLFPQDHPLEMEMPLLDHSNANCWLQKYVKAHCCIASYDYRGGLDIFAELLQYFPENVHILLEIAKVEAIIGKNDEAIANFEKAQSVDPCNMTYMDEYAVLLRIKPDHDRLHLLILALQDIDATRPEVLVALSLREDIGKRRALEYAEQCLQVDSRNILGHITKGSLLCYFGREEEAIAALERAKQLRPDIRARRALVHGLLRFSKVQDALHAAWEATRAMPRSAQAFKLVADVWARSHGGEESAKLVYRKAIQLDPSYLEATLALASVLLAQRQGDAAVTLLERYFNNWPDRFVHASEFMNNLRVALIHQVALRIYPQSEAARSGLIRLEQLIEIHMRS